MKNNNDIHSNFWKSNTFSSYFGVQFSQWIFREPNYNLNNHYLLCTEDRFKVLSRFTGMTDRSSSTFIPYEKLSKVYLDTREEQPSWMDSWFFSFTKKRRKSLKINMIMQANKLKWKSKNCIHRCLREIENIAVWKVFSHLYCLHFSIDFDGTQLRKLVDEFFSQKS